jgi:hypothetical protein
MHADAGTPNILASCVLPGLDTPIDPNMSGSRSFPDCLPHSFRSVVVVVGEVPVQRRVHILTDELVKQLDSPVTSHYALSFTDNFALRKLLEVALDALFVATTYPLITQFRAAHVLRVHEQTQVVGRESATRAGPLVGHHTRRSCTSGQ